MIDSAKLRCVITVAQCGSFRRAALALGVQQSSVSRTVRQVEDGLGVSLFERRTTGTHLTDAGRRLLSETRPALAQLERACTAAVAAGRGEVGTLRVGVGTTLVGGFLRDLLRRYTAQHPDVMVDIQDGSQSDLVAAIRRRSLDILFVPCRRFLAGCDTASLWNERLHVALSTGHRLAGQDQVDWPELQAETFLVSRFAPGPDIHTHILRRAAEGRTDPDIADTAAGQETVLNLVGLGQGIALVPAAWRGVRFPDVVLRPMADEADMLAFGAAWSPESDNPALRRLISLAHMMAGRVRRGTSDWSGARLSYPKRSSVISAHAQTRDLSP